MEKHKIKIRLTKRSEKSIFVEFFCRKSNYLESSNLRFFSQDLIDLLDDKIDFCVIKKEDKVFKTVLVSGDCCHVLNRFLEKESIVEIECEMRISILVDIACINLFPRQPWWRFW